MPFPKELDPTALRQLIRFATGADRDKGRAALAAYDLAGFGLGKAFPDAQYLADAPPAEPALLKQTDPILGAMLEEMMNAEGERLKQLLEILGPILLKIFLKLITNDN